MDCIWSHEQKSNHFNSTWFKRSQVRLLDQVHYQRPWLAFGKQGEKRNGHFSLGKDLAIPFRMETYNQFIMGEIAMDIVPPVHTTKHWIWENSFSKLLEIMRFPGDGFFKARKGKLLSILMDWLWQAQGPSPARDLQHCLPVQAVRKLDNAYSRERTSSSFFLPSSSVSTPFSFLSFLCCQEKHVHEATIK